MAAGKQRNPQGEGCRWLLMPGGGRREVRGRGCMWLEWWLPHPNCSPPNIVLVTMANSFPQTPPTSSLHPTRLHCISQTPHRDSFSTCAPNPFLLPPLPPTPPLPFRVPLRPKTSLKEPAIHPFPTVTTLLSPVSSSYTFFPSLQRHPTGAPKPGLTMPAPQPPKRCLNQPPTAIPAMLSTLLSLFQLVPGFRPLWSGIKYVLICNISVHSVAFM